jgi:SH3-like domain-containing protein
MKRKYGFLILCIISSFACTLTSTPVPATLVATSSSTNISFPPVTDTPFLSSATASTTPTETLTQTPPASETASPFPSHTALPTVESLKARVTADRLSCRYGPGPEYLYLFAFRSGANIELIGRVDAENWNWVLVENQVPCWVSAEFIEVQGDVLSLPVMYPDGVKLPITPYYPPSEVTSARRDPLTNQVTVAWAEIPVSPGDYEDDSMQTYILEVWRCQAGQLIFDPLATRSAFISFVDEPGCSEPSHGRVWVQEKHGYAGPAEIPWPE